MRGSEPRANLAAFAHQRILASAHQLLFCIIIILPVLFIGKIIYLYLTICLTMKFSVDKHEKYVLVKLNESKLNSSITPQLKSELILMNTEGQRNIILDLSAVKFADSSGLSSLLVGHRLCKNGEGSFVLVGLNSAVARLVTISQLDNVLTIVNTADEAMDLIFMEEIEKELKKEAK